MSEKTPEEKGLNPNARAFAPKPGGKGKGKGKVEEDFVMNIDATPWMPTSFQAQRSSRKPVVILFGAPGSGVTELGDELAKEFNGIFHSSWRTRKRVIEGRRSNFDSRPTSVWSDTRDALKELDLILAKTHTDPSVKGYFIDIQCRNNAVFHYVSYILGQYGLVPGQVFYLNGLTKEALQKNLVESEGEDQAAASKMLDYYLGCEADRMAVFSGVKGLVTEIDATQSHAALLETASAQTKTVFEKVLSFSLPKTSPYPSLTPVHNVAEYHHVMSVLSERVSGGDPRYPGTKDTGSLQIVDGKVVNSKPSGGVPTGESHKIFKRTEGLRYLMIYTPVYGNPEEGRFYLVPKGMDVIYTFKPRIGDVEYAEGKAPLYGEVGSLTTMIFDGEIVKMKTGWGGLVGMGCQQLIYVANDILYFEAEKPRDRISKSEHWTLDRRIELLNRTKWPHDEYAPSDTNSVSLCIRTYHHLSRLPQLIESVDEQDNSFKTTGIGFTPTRRYQPYADPSLITWNVWPSKHITLKVAQNGSAHTIYAKKAYGDSSEVKIGTTSDSPISHGTAQCRIVWDDQPGSGYKWVVDGVSEHPWCWEVAGVDAYVDPKNWVSAKELEEQLYAPPPPEPERKAKVEKIGEEEEEEEHAQHHIGGRGKGYSGRGSGRGR